MPIRTLFSLSSVAWVVSFDVTYDADIRTQCINCGFTWLCRELGLKRREFTERSGTDVDVTAATASRRSWLSTTLSECYSMKNWFWRGVSSTSAIWTTSSETHGITQSFHLWTSRRLTGQHHSSTDSLHLSRLTTLTRWWLKYCVQVMTHEYELNRHCLIQNTPLHKSFTP